mmetsp:Transcript_41135/g.124253  ORF Transcript_41135/g.124253 Transcript_41135/m.124253 type:complete len:855 (-) Transcript_41135:361-2925(-)
MEFKRRWDDGVMELHQKSRDLYVETASRDIPDSCEAKIPDTSSREECKSYQCAEEKENCSVSSGDYSSDEYSSNRDDEKCLSLGPSRVGILSLMDADTYHVPESVWHLHLHSLGIAFLLQQEKEEDDRRKEKVKEEKAEKEEDAKVAFEGFMRHLHERMSSEAGPKDGSPLSRAQASQNEGMSFAAWKLQKDRERLALKSKENNTLDGVKKAMTGSPPTVPTLSVVSVSTNELTLAWAPGAKQTKVCFFLLEQGSHVVGKQSTSLSFKQIARDPEYAGEPLCGGKTITGLKPNAAYTFRIRAFNSHGASPCAQCTFATRPCASKPPELVRAFPHALMVRWGATDGSRYLGLSSFVLEKYNESCGKKWCLVWTGTSTTASLSGLYSGSSHKLRVAVVDDDGKRGLESASVIFNTLESTPDPPRVSSKGSDWIELEWNSYGGCRPAKQGTPLGKQLVDELIRDWLRVGEAGKQCSSLGIAFRKVDTEKRGFIEADRLEELLVHLGMDTTSPRVSEAVTSLKGERITLWEFDNWWKSVDNLRSHHVLSIVECNKVAKEETSRSNASETCYEGPETSFKVEGLKPSTLYKLRLQTITPKSRSSRSKGLLVMTLPAGPEKPPILVHIDDTFVIFKLTRTQPGKKFVVEKRLHSSRSNVYWKPVYEGSDRIIKIMHLIPGKTFEIRTRSVSECGEVSDPSDIIRFPSRDGRVKYNSKTLSKIFVVDCSDGHIVVGDLILFNELTSREGVGKEPQRRVFSDCTNGIGSRREASTTICQKQAGGVVVGERAVVARVMAQNRCRIKMEVVWTHVDWDCRAASASDLDVGSTIERDKKAMLSHETLRAAWPSEGRRIEMAERTH